MSGRHPPCAGKTLCGEDKLPFWGTVSSVCGEDPSKSVVRFPVAKVPASLTAALHSKVLRNLHGRMSSGPPQPYFVEILRRGGNTAARGRVFQPESEPVVQHPPSVSPVRGKDRIGVLFHKFYHSSGVLRVWEIFRGRSPFSFTKVPASLTVALYNRVLCDLHGRMSSGPPQPYFVEILRRGGNTAVGKP